MPADNANAWPAPAKLNLLLHITARRKDGMHELQTVFQLLDYSDQLEFEVNDTGCITRKNPVHKQNTIAEISPDSDLCVRAARLLQSHSGCNKGVQISLTKRIPIGAGLGGGSSDAATTLLALNHLWELGLPTEELSKLGATLGADVPVFVQGHSAWAEGIGELITPLSLPQRWFVVVFPDVAVSTAEIFGAKELTRDQRPIKIAHFLQQQELTGSNVMTKVVTARYPQVQQALDWLHENAPTATSAMSGSGSSVYAVFSSEDEANALLAAERPENWQIFVARGLNESPLLARLA